MDLLIVRDENRLGKGVKAYEEFEESGIRSVTCSSNIFAKLPQMESDLMIVDLMRPTLEARNFSFLEGMKNQKYRVVVVMADKYEKSDEVKALCHENGIDYYLERPMQNVTFYETVDQAMKLALQNEE